MHIISVFYQLHLLILAIHQPLQPADIEPSSCQSEHTKTGRQEVLRGYEPKDPDALPYHRERSIIQWRLIFLVAELNRIKSIEEWEDHPRSSSIPTSN